VSSRPHLLGALASWDVRRRVRRLFRSAASWVVASTDYAMWEKCFLQNALKVFKQGGFYSLIKLSLANIPNCISTFGLKPNHNAKKAKNID
jgi:hypothetical protein